VRPPAPAAASPVTWLLAIVLLAGIDAAVTRTSLLWGKTSTWVKSGIERVYVWQTYDVARKLYYPRRRAAVRVVLLGNSRIWFPARQPFVERALHRLDPRLDVRVDNLAIFGAHVGDMEIISRHLDRVKPQVVVVALGPADLVPTSWGKIVNATGELLDVGWRDGPIPPANETARVNRWLKTVWPLYCFRRFVRQRIEDGLFPYPEDTEFPDHFASRQDYFDFVNDKKRAAMVGDLYAAWRRHPTLAGFVDFLGGKKGRFGFTEPVPPPETLTLHSPGVLALDRLLARVSRQAPDSFVLLMPENPLLDDDTEGLYHRIGFSDHGAELIRRVAARYHVRVVDGRHWMPADRFVDFVHVFPDVSGFQDLLAKEILHALHS